ncbi:hypothetical protein POM88_033128 [Heracleum sosnowskyi]|uniref:Uncharacterized protein n=1 Tax=Heracleum sosnowskyi TaxID=360622 RepID=A0AAD8MI66_9APIA|nr:hypothetical protein POM88_033128 [Heracleum sosnowskyi]
MEVSKAMMVSENAENNVGEASNRANTSSGDETFQTRENRKRKESEGSCSETLDDAEDESNVPKKKSFSWTSEMHRKFVDAIAQIGEDSSGVTVPTIDWTTGFPEDNSRSDEPGLTRENVASHLQALTIRYILCTGAAWQEGGDYLRKTVQLKRFSDVVNEKEAEKKRRINELKKKIDDVH